MGVVQEASRVGLEMWKGERTGDELHREATAAERGTETSGPRGR